MRVAAIVGDLMLFSRIESAALSSGASIIRVDSPGDLPGDAFDMILVDWSARRPDWAEHLAAKRIDTRSRIVVFGFHTDLEAHADARAVGLGPMWARSKLVSELPRLMRT